MEALRLGGGAAKISKICMFLIAIQRVGGGGSVDYFSQDGVFMS